MGDVGVVWLPAVQKLRSTLGRELFTIIFKKWEMLAEAIVKLLSIILSMEGLSFK